MLCLVLFCFFNIYLFLVALGLLLCVQLSLIAARSYSWLQRLSLSLRLLLLLRAQPLAAWASVVVALRLRSSGTRAWLPHSMWNLPGPGIKPVSSALVDRFLSTALPGKSPASFSSCHSAPSSTFIISCFKVCNNLLSSL